MVSLNTRFVYRHASKSICLQLQYNVLWILRYSAITVFVITAIYWLCMGTSLCTAFSHCSLGPFYTSNFGCVANAIQTMENEASRFFNVLFELHCKWPKSDVRTGQALVWSDSMKPRNAFILIFHCLNTESQIQRSVVSRFLRLPVA